MIAARRARTLAYLLPLLIALHLATSRPAPAVDTCVECHAVLPEDLSRPVAGMEHDVHREKGLSCVDCHGGDATTMDETSMSPEKGYRGKPKRADIPAFCGRCHADAAYMRRFNPREPTDQLQQYWTSVHGQRLQKGDEKVATCVSCHGVHGILSPSRADSPVYPVNVSSTCGACHSKAEYMTAYGIPTDQEQHYKRSVHAELLFEERDLSAPTCNDCHGNHGAFPPGASSIAEVCGACHANNAALFEKSPHRQAFEQKGLPACVTCHSNHEIHRTSDDMLGGDSGSVCRRCHDAESPGYTAAVVMRGALDRLKSVIERADGALQRAKQMGMEVSEEEYTMKETVRPELIKVRTETHRGDPEAVVAAVGTAVKEAEASETAAEATLAEAEARRRNLLIPLALIVLLMVLLRLKLRQLEGPRRRR